MSNLGYNSYYQVLNAKDYGIPQNRERIFTISIRKDLDDGNFIFPEKQELSLRLKDMLEENPDEKYYLSDEYIRYAMQSTENEKNKGNGFKFEPVNVCGEAAERERVAKSITSKAGQRMTDNFIKELL